MSPAWLDFLGVGGGRQKGAGQRERETLLLFNTGNPRENVFCASEKGLLSHSSKVNTASIYGQVT